MPRESYSRRGSLLALVAVSLLLLAFGVYQSMQDPDDNGVEADNDSTDPTVSVGEGEDRLAAEEREGEHADEPGAEEAVAEPRKTILAVFGVYQYEDNSRPDAAMVVGIDSSARRIYALAIPMDYGHGGESLVREEFLLGGPEATTSAIRADTGIDVSQYVVLNYEAFEAVIDRLGGVPVVVDEPIRVASHIEGEFAEVPEGAHDLDGKQSLAYIRYKPEDDEIGRLERQLRFSLALKARLSERSVILRIPSTIRDLFALIETNMTLSNLLALANSITWASIESVTLASLASEAVAEDGRSVRLVRDPTTDDELSLFFGI